jgi:YD repeat-containing protein
MANKIVTTYRAWRKYRQTYNELSRLSTRDLADLGINRAEIQSIARQAATAL